ncbi:MAG: hypothetical protein IT210_17075 [Armatimonadetes bacterium]|nr:hypothetical protein [Armatimonadota bacterium]
MTPKERLLAVFEGATPDAAPWIADLTCWHAAHESGGDLPDRYRGAGVVKLYQDLRCGAHKHCLSLPCAVRYSGVEMEVATGPQGLPASQTTAWHIPLGTLTPAQVWEPASACWAYRRYPVASVADLKVLRYIPEHQEATPDDGPQREQMALWDDTGVAGTILLRSQRAGLLVTWMGVQNTVYALADAPEEVDAILSAIAEAESPFCEAAALFPVPLVCLADNITGEVVSPRLFEKRYVPFYRRRIPPIQEASKKPSSISTARFRGCCPLSPGRAWTAPNR